MDLGQGSGGRVEECGGVVREGGEEGASPRPLPYLLAQLRNLRGRIGFGATKFTTDP